MPHPNRQRADLTKHAHLGNKVPAPRILRAASRRQHCVTFRRQFNQIESIHPSIHHSTSTSTSTAKSNPTTILCADCQVSFCSRTSLIQHRMMEHWVFSMHPFFFVDQNRDALHRLPTPTLCLCNSSSNVPIMQALRPPMKRVPFHGRCRLGRAAPSSLSSPTTALGSSFR